MNDKESKIKCKHKDIHCPTLQETLDYYENFLIPGYEEEIEKLQKEIEEKTTIIMAGAEKVKQLEKEFITKQEIKDNYIPKDKIREKLEIAEHFQEKHEEFDGENFTYQDIVNTTINAYKELLEEE